MYAIIRSGGKQHRVEAGHTVQLERLAASVGDKVVLDDVLLVAGEGEPRLGSPRLSGVQVVGTVIEQGRENKLRVFKFKKRKHYRRSKGHRQSYTAVRIDTIEG